MWSDIDKVWSILTPKYLTDFWSEMSVSKILMASTREAVPTIKTSVLSALSMSLLLSIQHEIALIHSWMDNLAHSKSSTKQLLDNSIIHLSFASLALGTQAPGLRHYFHIRSLEAYKSPANIRWLPHRAGHLRRRVTDKVPALIPREFQLKFPAQMITIKPRPQPRTCSPSAGQSACTNSPTLSQRVPPYCLDTRGLGIQMIGALNIISACKANTALHLRYYWSLLLLKFPKAKQSIYMWSA